MEVLSNYLSLHSNPEFNIWHFYQYLKVCSLILNKTSVISIIVPTVDDTFHLQLYLLHIVPMVNSILHKTMQIQVGPT